MGNGEFEEVHIKKIGVLSVAVFFALTSFFVGILLSLILIFGVSTILSFYPVLSTYAARYLPSNSLIAMIIPSTFLILGFAIGAFSALIYNLLGRVIGIKLYA